MTETIGDEAGTKTCSGCGSTASGKFCANCGNALGASQSKRGALRTTIALSFAAALLYVTFVGIPSFNVFGSNLDLSIEVAGGDQRYGFVLITNLGDKPIELREVRINRRTDDACVDKDHKKLATGERAMVGTDASIVGHCGGSIVRVTVITDQGQADYTINW
jgi:hypothetical protein